MQTSGINRPNFKYNNRINKLYRLTLLFAEYTTCFINPNCTYMYSAKGGYRGNLRGNCSFSLGVQRVPGPLCGAQGVSWNPGTLSYTDYGTG